MECLDAIVAEGACERCYGCILCPGEGNGQPYNLLAQGPIVRFYKLQTGNVQSRQATDGIIIPTVYPATVDEWPHVLRQLEQWAFDGDSPISSLSDRTYRNCLINKLLQCPRCSIYKPKTPQHFDRNGLREGIRLDGIRKQRENQNTALHKRSKGQCEPSQRPSKRVVCATTQRLHTDVTTCIFIAKNKVFYMFTLRIMFRTYNFSLRIFCLCLSRTARPCDLNDKCQYRLGVTISRAFGSDTDAWFLILLQPFHNSHPPYCQDYTNTVQGH